jgi:O-6-methylguanine DNA methyltransferase
MKTISPAVALFATEFETPIGPVRAIASDFGLCGLPFLPRPTSEHAVLKSGTLFERRLQRWFDAFELHDGPTHAVMVRTREWLTAYFAGRRDVPSPPLDLRGTTFERRVWAALLEVAVGTTASYGTIAQRLGNLRASRAVGLANGANPVPIIVPCHRIIGASGTLTGYGGGLERKAWLLAHERRYWGANSTLL